MDDKLKILTEKKKKLDLIRPLTEETIGNLEEWLKVELTYSSNAIEGNTLSRIETAEVIEKGVSATISGKPLKDQLEAINHARALDFIKDLATQRKGHQFITEDDILAIHKIILSGIIDDWAGKYRQTEILIRGVDVELPEARDVPRLMGNFIKWLEEKQEEHPVRIASIAHYRFEGIHPFIDGNGRVGRLLMNLILILNGYPMAIIRNEQRAQYLNAFKVGQSTNDWSLLLNMIEDAVERSLDAYINAAEGKAVLPSLMGEEVQTEEGKLYKIGELAKTVGETIPTIRYWTNEGLLKAASLTKGGYALYDSSQIDKAKEVRYLQDAQRLTIAEIKVKLGVKIRSKK